MRFSQLNSFTTGRITVTVAGTPVQGAANEIPPGVSVTIKALSANTGTVTLGNSSTNSLASGTTSFRLLANQSVDLEVINLDRVWCDATVSGEGVEFIFER